MKKTAILFILFLITQLSAQTKWDLKIYNETSNGVFMLYADNNEPMPMSVQFDFTLKNLSNTLPNKQNIVLPAQTKRIFIAKLKPIISNAANQFSYNSSYNFGDVNQEKYDEHYIYELPFESGKTYSIYQGYNGKFSHNNEFSLDFSLKTGDKIYAAREGVVIEATDTYNTGCPNVSCVKLNNRILVMHPDGTIADYSHLKFKGTMVKKGEFIEKGQFLGYSGNTGFSSGPHLHFAVFLNRMDGSRTFIKTPFLTSDSEQEYLAEGKSYKKPLTSN